jgi:hypothetical protein
MVVASERTNAQTSRRGWRPRRTSDSRLAADIAASIKAHGVNGVIKVPTDYSSRLEIIEAIERLLNE